MGDRSGVKAESRSGERAKMPVVMKVVVIRRGRWRENETGPP